MARILCVAGTRPNFVKIAPILRALDAHEAIEGVLVHTGQHYDRRMSGVFFEQLGLRDPDVHLGAGSGSHAEQTARVMQALEPVLIERAPHAVLVVGDVNSTLAAALTAKKLHVPVVHVEAGLRSGDRRMPEEINRIATDAISDLLLVSEPSGLEHLRREGIQGDHVVHVGNVMIDSLARLLPAARSLAQAGTMGLEPGRFVLSTLHRPETVDHAPLLAEALDILAQASRIAPVVLPLHPRTKGRIDAFGLMDRLDGADIRPTDPLGYLEFMGLMADSGLVITDSGGIQEETTWLGIPCVTLRPSTERPVTITEGTNRLYADVRDEPDWVGAAFDGGWKSGRIPDLWDGKAAERVAEQLARVYAG